ncbi:MAG: alpha/beta hydrolase [Propionibacteriaceae bacterium]|nr:alpha/beta hydrolase [Propionibacteriaceae bacterium]
MPIPQWCADGVAKLAQRAPGSARIASDIAFADIPATTLDARVPTRHGPVPVTVYLPEAEPSSAGVYINLHGGGFVMRHPEQDDPLCRFIAARAGVSVVNVDYIPAPQSRFPGPVEQAFDVALWAAAPGRPWDGSRIAVGGQSAGGALAAGTARLALERGAPKIALQVLLYPPLDLCVPARSKMAKGKESFLARMGPAFDAAYCPDPQDRQDRLISPAGKADQASIVGIAPALVVTAGRDILRDEAVRYASRLGDAGALIGHIDIPSVGHGFNILGAPREIVLPVYQRIAREASRAVGGVYLA